LGTDVGLGHDIDRRKYYFFIILACYIAVKSSVAQTSGANKVLDYLADHAVMR
jgi:hypothetical protein